MATGRIINIVGGKGEEAQQNVNLLSACASSIEADTGELCVGLYNAYVHLPTKRLGCLKTESARRLRDARPIGTTIYAVDVPTHATCRHRGKIAVCLKLEWSFGP